jgi:glycosyltransferase involved in cell wall biosynthesis
MMHPIVIITKLDAGGMERFCVNLCNAFVAQGRACTLCALHPAADGGARTWLSADVEYVELGRRARLAAPALVRLCRRAAREPVLALSLEVAALLLALKRLGLVANPVLYRESTAVLAHYRGVWRWIVGRVAAGADGLVVQSGQALLELRSLGCVSGRVRVLRNPCSLPLPRDPPSFRLPLPPDGLRLLCVGRLEHMKGHERLLRAMPALRRRLPGVCLTIAGTGSQSSRLRELVVQLKLADAVSMPGFVPQPELLYRGAHLLVLPSFYEGLPNVVIEALAAGCPVVAAGGAGGTQEFMHALGLGGFLVSDAAFAECLSDGIDRVRLSRPEVWQRAYGLMVDMVRPDVVADCVWQLFLDTAGKTA